MEHEIQGGLIVKGRTISRNVIQCLLSDLLSPPFRHVDHNNSRIEVRLDFAVAQLIGNEAIRRCRQRGL